MIESTASAVPLSGGEPLVRCERLVVGYGGRAMLPPIDLEVRPGRFLAVLGRNGSGKSTFFKTLLGLLPPVGGAVRWSGARPRVAYVPQLRELDALLPLRARELVAWGLQSRSSFLRPFLPREERHAIDAALRDAGALELSDRFVRELSEGQKQRVLFARVLASGARLALLDEPTAAMDSVAGRETIGRLAALAHERQTAVVVITHSMSAAAHLADEVLFLDPEQQAVVCGGREQVLGHAAFRKRFGDLEAVCAC